MMKRVIISMILLATPAQAHAAWHFCLFGCHPAHHHRHHRYHHRDKVRVIVHEKEVEKIIVEKPKQNSPRPFAPLDPVK